MAPVTVTVTHLVVDALKQQTRFLGVVSKERSTCKQNVRES